MALFCFQAFVGLPTDCQWLALGDAPLSLSDSFLVGQNVPVWRNRNDR
jgi:hypothetical protein